MSETRKKISSQSAGRPNSWPDGTPKSQFNAFTSHGYVRGAPVAPSPAPAKRGPRSRVAFGQVGGTILGMGPDAAPAMNRKSWTVKRKT